MAVIAAAMFWGSGYAADNSIYIDQSGDNSTITMTQDGSGNKVKGILVNGTAGGTTDAAKLTGNAQTINIEQTGAANVLSLGVNTTQGGSVTGYANIGVNLNYQVTDGSNTGYININNNGLGTAKGDVVSIVQSGGSATSTLNMTGTSNQLGVTQGGGANNSFTGTINADETVATVSNTGGGGNSTTLNMTGNKGQVSVTTVGATNTTSVTQTGLFDQYANIGVTGDSNTITLAQSGGHAGGAGQSATMTVTGSSNVISATQQGTVSNMLNMAVSGSSNHYTILQKN